MAPLKKIIHELLRSFSTVSIFILYKPVLAFQNHKQLFTFLSAAITLFAFGNHGYGQLQTYALCNFPIRDFAVTSDQHICVLDTLNSVFCLRGGDWVKSGNENSVQLGLWSDTIWMKNADNYQLPEPIYGLRQSFPLQPVFSRVVAYRQKNWLHQDTILYNIDGAESIRLPNGVVEVSGFDNRLFALKKQGLFEYTDRRWRAYKLPGMAFDHSFTSLTADINTVVVADSSYIYVFDENTYDLQTYFVGYPTNKILTDRQNNIWVMNRETLRVIPSQKPIYPRVDLWGIKSSAIDSLTDFNHMYLPAGSRVTILAEPNAIFGREDINMSIWRERHDTGWLPYNIKNRDAAIKEGVNAFRLRGEHQGETYISPLYTIHGTTDPSTNAFPLWIIIPLLMIIGFMFLLWRMEVNRSKDLGIKLDALRLQIELSAVKTENFFLKFNPHFIFNVLAGIQGLIANNEPEKARRQLRNFGLFLRKVLDHPESGVVSVQEDIDFVESYLDLVRTIENKAILWHINKEFEVIETDRLHALTTQIAVENAIKHGRPSQNQPLEIAISYEKNPAGQLVVRITDNGGGLTEKQSSHHSKGLSMVRGKLGGDEYYLLKNRVISGQVVGCEAEIIHVI